MMVTTMRAGTDRFGRLLLVLLLVSGSCLFGAGGAQAAPTAATVPTMLVLDASGSMAAKDGDSAGRSRMDVAKDAAGALVEQVPQGAELGLEVYGARTGNTGADKKKGCRDVEVVAPVDSGNASTLHEGIDGVGASGYTPIGAALKKAAKNLPTTGPRSIVLVSDGIDSCAPPDPCTVAQDLKTQGVDLAVHVIGFKVDQEARTSLRCIAEKTGGTYTDVADGDQLAGQLISRTTRTLQGYQVDGAAVRGGATPAKAPTVDAGPYLDTFEHGSKKDLGEGQTKYYRIPVREGERVHASAALIPPPGDRGYQTEGADSGRVLFIESHVVDAAGNRCETGATDNVGNVVASESPVRSSVDSAPAGSDSCDGGDGELFLEVTRAGAKLHDQPLPVEIRIGLEDPTGEAGQQGPEERSDPPTVKPTNPATKKVTLGRAAGQAPELQPGTYRVEMVPGDVGLAKIPVAEGQRLSWRLATEHEVSQQDDAGVPNIASASVLMLNPLLEPSATGPTEMVASEDPQYAETGGMPSPIRRANLDASSADVPSTWLAGDQYVQLALGTGSGSDESAREPSTFLLTLQVDGTAEKSPGTVRTEAAHPNATTVSDQDVSAASDAGASDAGGAGDAGTASDDGSGSDTGASPGADEAPSGTSSRRGPLVIGAVGAGVVAIAALALGAWLVLRRRN